MLLEAIHTYSLVAFVVKRNGLLTKTQNVLSGWMLSIAIILIVASLQFENYGGECGQKVLVWELYRDDFPDHSELLENSSLRQ